MLKTLRWVANSVDPDDTVQNTVFTLYNFEQDFYRWEIQDRREQNDNKIKWKFAFRKALGGACALRHPNHLNLLIERHFYGK